MLGTRIVHRVDLVEDEFAVGLDPFLFRVDISGAEIVAANTDKQHLDIMEADKKILIGRDLTRVSLISFKKRVLC